MWWALLAVAVVVVVLVVILSQGAKEQPPAPAGAATDHRPAAPVPTRAAPPGMTAAEMLRRLDELDKAGAQWPAIWEQLNPDGNAAVQQLLIDFRGPYMFVPHAAINVLRIGCERALAVSPTADRVAAIGRPWRRTTKWCVPAEWSADAEPGAAPDRRGMTAFCDL